MRICILAVVLCATCLSVTCSAATDYRVIDLGVGTYALDINNHNDYVGYVGPAWPPQVDNALICIGGTSTVFGGSGCKARYINDRRQVVVGSGANTFLWEGGQMKALDMPAGGASMAYGLNNLGQVAGFVSTAQPNREIRGGIWESDGVLSTKLEWTAVAGVTDSGNVLAIEGNGPVLYEGSLGTRLSYDLNLEGTFGINEAGQIIGNIGYDGYHHAFMWQSGILTDLGTVTDNLRYKSSFAGDINDEGLIVGSSSYPNGYGSVAVLWRNGAIVDLNACIPSSTGLTLTGAMAINDVGWIVCRAYDSNGDPHGAILAPVPEPSSILVLLCGLGGLGCLVRKRRR